MASQPTNGAGSGASIAVRSAQRRAAGPDDDVVAERLRHVEAQSDEPVERGALRGEVFPDQLGPGREMRLDDREGEFFLADVMEVDGSAGTAGLRADVADTGPGVSPLIEQACCRFQKKPTRVFRPSLHVHSESRFRC